MIVGFDECDWKTNEFEDAHRARYYRRLRSFDSKWRLFFAQSELI